jgi:hypothetical protein
MNRLFLSLAFVFLAVSPAKAIPITFFVDTPTFVERSGDIVVAKCLRPDVGEGTYIDNLHPAEVEVVMVLKGGAALGKLRIATVYELKAGEMYLLANSGGRAYDTNFLAIAERAAVKLPDKFKLDDLKGKKIVEQVDFAFKAAGLKDSDLLSKTLVPPVEVTGLPPGLATTFEEAIQKDKERMAQAVQKLQQSKGEQDIKKALHEVEEAVNATKATLETWKGFMPKSPPSKPVR